LTGSPKVIDYGCGTGSTAKYLRRELHAEQVLGMDVSEDELRIARENHPKPWARFCNVNEYWPDESFDVVYCNGTFHHIPPAERADVVKFLFDSLAPGGWLGLWENNPWNPGTRMVMKKIPFDRDAITLSIPETRRMVASAGFEVVRSDSLFYFPKSLAVLRPVERWLTGLPLGGQYLVLGKKPVGAERTGYRSREKKVA
jgi:trans-aconitate methyltransferase